MFAAKNELFSRPNGGYNLTRSLRFRGAYPTAPSYLSRTAGTPTNNLKWTYSLWVKRGVLGVGQFLLNGGTGTSASEDYLAFFGSDKISFSQANASSTYLLTASVYRDPAAWYHIVFVYDSAQATASNRAVFYVNGVQVTSFSNATYPTLNQSTNINASGVLQRISSRTYAADEGFDGYITEINFVDGQALTPSSLGEFNIYNVWQPKKYVGTYGNNGFYLPFTNNASTTTLGYDFSGNGNNWTTTKISVTTGSTYDSTTDVPTLTSATVANYATLNPLYVCTTSSVTNPTLTNGNLTFVGNATTDTSSASTIGMSSGSFYCEVTINYVSAIQDGVGIAYTQSSSSRASGVLYRTNGNKCIDNTVTAYGSSYVAGDIIGIAVDATNNQVTFYKNGVSQGAISFTPTTANFFSTYGTNNSPAFGGSVNFGQQPFKYTPPTGFVALNTFNL